MAPPQQCGAAQQCADTLNDAISDAGTLKDKIQRLQANCQALTTMVHCMCTGCENTVESDPGFISAHETFCSPAMMAQFRMAGGKVSIPRRSLITTHSCPSPWRPLCIQSYCRSEPTSRSAVFSSRTRCMRRSSGSNLCTHGGRPTPQDPVPASPLATAASTSMT